MTYNLNNLVIIFYSLFAISLPFNAFEWDIVGIDRFEIKITMITFILLFVVWVLVIQKNGIQYKNNEFFIYSLMFIYICTQYLSIINSTYFIESLRQSIIISSFAIMMIVSSQLIFRSHNAHYIVICMGFMCIIISIIMLIIFYYYLGIVPSSQRIDLEMEIPKQITGFYLIDTVITGYWDGFFNSIYHLILPSFILGFSVVGLLARVTRASILEVISQDYVRTARSKGLQEKTVIGRHVMRNALIPTVTILGLLVGGLLSGAVLTETIFAWPGVGRFAVQSIMLLDRLAVVDVTILIGIAFSTANMIVDIVVAFLDPRIRY